MPTKRDDIEIAADKKPSVDQSKVKEDSKSSVADENVLSLKQQRKLELKQRKLVIEELLRFNTNTPLHIHLIPLKALYCAGRSSP